MDMLDIHAKKLKLHVFKYGRTVTLTEPDGITTHEVKTLWNSVDHGLKIEGLSADPMGSKESVYFDTDTLFNLNISPDQGWKLTGSPNKYEPVETYVLEIPKIDRQLPGKLFFLSKSSGNNTGWSKV